MSGRLNLNVLTVWYVHQASTLNAKGEVQLPKCQLVAREADKNGGRRGAGTELGGWRLLQAGAGCNWSRWHLSRRGQSTAKLHLGKADETFKWHRVGKRNWGKNNTLWLSKCLEIKDENLLWSPLHPPSVGVRSLGYGKIKINHVMEKRRKSIAVTNMTLKCQSLTCQNYTSVLALVFALMYKRSRGGVATNLLWSSWKKEKNLSESEMLHMRCLVERQKQGILLSGTRQRGDRQYLLIIFRQVKWFSFLTCASLATSSLCWSCWIC